MDNHDELKLRCPSLGGPVPFKYCRTMNHKLPCQRIVACWGTRFDVVAWLSENYSPAELKQAFTQDTRSRLEKILQVAHEATGKEKKKNE